MSESTVVTISAGAIRRAHALPSLLSPAAREKTRVEANRWIKQLRLVSYEGRTMRQRFTYRGESLWWFTEIYLHKMRQLERAIETILALEHACAADAASVLVVQSDDPDVRCAAEAFRHARKVPVTVEGSATSRTRREKMRGFLVGPAALLSRARRGRADTNRTPARVAAFIHSAFWRESDDAGSGGRESYIGPVLDALKARVNPDDLAYVGVGPARTFRTRRWWDPMIGRRSGPSVTPIERLAPRRAIAEALDLWRDREALAAAIVVGADIRAAGIWRDYDLWPVLSDALAQAARVQWPWSARSMDEARAALVALRPEVLLTYAEAGGWGRALMLEARRAGIPSVGLQHGFIYRHWLNYQHEADEMQPDGDERGFPRPDRTLLFDGYAQQTLEDGGHFPAGSLAITGSPRLDELASRLSHSGTSLGLGLSDDMGPAETQRTVVVAAKFIEIERELPALVQAIGDLPGVLCIIKPHPSETGDLYRPYVGAAPRIVIESAAMDLGRLLKTADGIITMNSTVAIDGLVLGRPALVVGLPSNLSPFVEAGVMLGASGSAIRTALETLLYDAGAKDRLLARGAAFAAAHQMRTDGLAASRAADHILALATRTSPQPRGHEGTT